MRIQILSDLHLEIERPNNTPGQEFYHYDIPVRADYLALLGDIGWTVDDRLFDWLKIQLEKFRTIFFVSGNHEPYRSSISESALRLDNFAAEVNSDSALGNFVHLNQTRYDLDSKLTVLGCTLWTALNPDDLDILSWSLTDFRRIDSFNPDAYMALHRGDLEWLNSSVRDITKQEPERDIFVFTHHAPVIEGSGDPKYIGQPTNSAFATDLTRDICWASGKVKLWAFGHTHWSCDFEKNGVRAYSNQRGYGEGGKGYNVERTVLL